MRYSSAFALDLQVLDFDLPSELSTRLEEISRPEMVTSYLFYGPEMQAMQTGGAVIRHEPLWLRAS